MTRWGAPSMRVETTVPVTVVCRYWALTASGTRLSEGEQEPGAHGDAVGAIGEGRHQAAAVEVAAGRHDHHPVADGVDHLGQQQRRGHRPGVAAALAALRDHRVDPPLDHLLGVPAGAQAGGA